MLQRADLAEFHKHFDKTVQKTFDERQEMLDNYPMLDENGYPTSHCIQIVKDCNDLGVSDQFLNLYADSFNVMHKRNRQLMDHLKNIHNQ